MLHLDEILQIWPTSNMHWYSDLVKSNRLHNMYGKYSQQFIYGQCNVGLYWCTLNNDCHIKDFNINKSNETETHLLEQI